MPLLFGMKNLKFTVSTKDVAVGCHEIGQTRRRTSEKCPTMS